jgi:thiol-disulfide isomerase/thioredoxin
MRPATRPERKHFVRGLAPDETRGGRTLAIMVRIRRLAPALLTGIALVVLAGCSPSTGEGEPVAGAPSATSSPSPTPAADATSAPPAAEADVTPGAYVDYRDGILAETAGTKVLFFHAPWCPQCRSLEASIQEGEIPDGVTIIKADFDSEIALRQQYGVTLQTTIVYVGDDGELLSSAVLYSDTSLDALLAAAP